MTKFATSPTPQPSARWVNMSSIERLTLISSVTSSSAHKNIVKPVSALSSGFIYVELISPLTPAERGIKLRDYEALLKSEIDEGLTVWCEPVGDKSALRKLRGIQVKAI